MTQQELQFEYIQDLKLDEYIEYQEDLTKNYTNLPHGAY